RASYEKAVGGPRRPYPQVKIVGLGECGTHALIDATIGSIRHGERERAEPLPRSLEANMLLMADRGFFSYTLWRAYLRTGAQLLWRLTKTTDLPLPHGRPGRAQLAQIEKLNGPAHH